VGEAFLHSDLRGIFVEATHIEYTSGICFYFHHVLTFTFSLFRFLTAVLLVRSPWPLFYNTSIMLLL
jgi:hypothetical protein